jgi:hypothetical protein
MYGSQFHYTNVPLTLAEISTSAATITLDMNGLVERNFVATPAIAAPKTWVLINDTNGQEFYFYFELTGVDAQTFPADFEMSDGQWDSGTTTWTPMQPGKYRGHVVYNGTVWAMQIIGPFT